MLAPNVPSESLLSVRGMKGRASSGEYSNLGIRDEDFQKSMFSKKRKRVLISSALFSPKLMVFSKKKGLHFDFVSNFPIFLPKSRCSKVFI